MALSISMKPLSKIIPLDIDPSEETTVTVRQATQGDHIALGDIFGDQTQIWDDPSGRRVKIQKKWNVEELYRYRVWRTMTDCNIKVEETGAPWFTTLGNINSAKAQAQFFSEYDALPAEIADSIYRAILIVNPEWDPNREGE